MPPLPELWPTLLGDHDINILESRLSNKASAYVSTLLPTSIWEKYIRDDILYLIHFSVTVSPYPIVVQPFMFLRGSQFEQTYPYQMQKIPYNLLLFKLDGSNEDV